MNNHSPVSYRDKRLYKQKGIIPPSHFETFRGGKFTIVSEEDRPKSFRELKGFLTCNGGRDCFSKWGGDVYMITLEGTWSKVCRCLPDLTFSQYLYLSK